MHASCESYVPIRDLRIRRNAVDRWLGNVRILAYTANFNGRLRPIHLGHAVVHQNDFVNGLRLFDRVFEALTRESST